MQTTMSINWRAVAIGFVVTVIVGLLSGFTIPLTNMTLPALGWAVTGILGGVAAGYVAGNGVWNGAVHGALGTTIGAVIVIGIMAVFGTLLFGLVGMGLFLVPLLLLGLYAIPGAIGGAVGAVVKGSEPVEMGQPAGR